MFLYNCNSSLQKQEQHEYAVKESIVNEAVDEKSKKIELEMTKKGDEIKKEYNTESYDHIVENPFVSTLLNPVSTFGIDVDKASYSNMRRFLHNNILPPPGAIRIEELINYFDYNYPQPDDEHPFSVNLSLTNCYWNKNHKLLSIGLKGKETPLNNIPPANLVLLLDVSGSMRSPHKLPLLKRAFKVLLKQLRPDDKVAIVVYAGAAGLVLPSTKCSEKDKIIDAFEKLEAGGSTAGGEGIKLAYKIAAENFTEQGNNRVIIATDGDFNVGESSDAAMVKLIEEKRESGIFLTVLGFGMGNYNDSMMEKLSNAGNGNYAYIDNILEAQKVLGHEMWRTLYTIAKDVKLQIEFNPYKVKGYRLIGYENRTLNSEDFNDDKKDAGDIGAGHTVTALYEIIPSGSEEKISEADELEYRKQEVVKSDNILTLKLRYKQPQADKSTLMLRRMKESDIFTDKPDENFRFAASIAEFGLLLRNSKFKGTASFKALRNRAKEAMGEDKFGYRKEFLQIVNIAEALSE